MEGFLFQATIYLGAAVIAVPLASRMGLGSVLGYLLAGLVIGPILGIVGSETADLQHFAEFGVVMMLFLIGLELEPRVLWAMRDRLIGLGGLQVVLTTLLIMGGGMALGLTWSVALAVGLAFALSSTAIVLQTLSEKGLMQTNGGRSAFAVLLTQDVAVIPMLALLPLLALSTLQEDHAHAQPIPETAIAAEATAPVATAGDNAVAGSQGEAGTEAGVADGHGGGDAGLQAGAVPDPSGSEAGHRDVAAGGHGSGDALPESAQMAFAFFDNLPAWGTTLMTLGSVAGIILAGIYLTRPVFSFIHTARLREMYTALALFIVVSIACLMLLVGLSPALGTFLAGVVLANSEFRHELESDLEPFKGLLLGLFFITVGAGINFGVLTAQPVTIVTLTLMVMLAKGLVLYLLTLIFGLHGRDRWLFTLGLAQAGEFGFVLIGFGLQQDVIPADLSQMLYLIVALSMLITPLFFIAYGLLSRRIAGPAAVTHAPDTIDRQGPIIIAGVGRFGQVVNRMIQMSGFRATVLDHDLATIRLMRRFGFKAFLGDPSRPELLHAAGLPDARVLVVAMDDPEVSTRIVKYARKERPDLHIVARAHDRVHVYQLYQAGADDIVREMFDSSLRAARYVLENMGLSEFEAAELEKLFFKLDRQAMLELATLWKPGISVADNEEYVARARQLNKDLETALVDQLDTSRRESDDEGEPGPGAKAQARKQAALKLRKSA